MPIEAVVFDVGRVLLDLDYQKMLAYLMKHRIDAHERGELAGEDMIDNFVKFAPVLDRAQLRELWLDIFIPIEPMFELVRQLTPRYRVYLLSNVGDLHWNHILEHYKLDTLGHGALPSFVTGSMKPDAAIYRAAEKQFRLVPARTVFIDDLDTNVQGARACGWQGIQFENHPTTVTRLAELGVTAA
jgi:HAD superfamily hydrolase (TIGR01509 family)